MNQHWKASAIEAASQTLIGYGISFGAQLVIYPAYGHSFTLGQNVQIGLWFMLLSFVRQYVLRRWFNGPLHAWCERFK